MKKSRFRSSIHLDMEEFRKARELGLERLEDIARKTIIERLNCPSVDGKQTPHKGIIFKAQHATATCCRKCMYRWHRIPHYRPLLDRDIEYMTGLILRWIRLELDTISLRLEHEECLLENPRGTQSFYSQDTLESV